MTLVISPEPPPLTIDANGDIRVGSSRVLLDLVIRAFEDGATPEAIVQRYPTAALQDVYGAIHYHLRHPERVKTYLADRDQRARAVQARVEARQGDLSAVRARLLARGQIPKQHSRFSVTGASVKPPSSALNNPAIAGSLGISPPH